jgi:hypothetical protein
LFKEKLGIDKIKQENFSNYFNNGSRHVLFPKFFQSISSLPLTLLPLKSVQKIYNLLTGMAWNRNIAAGIDKTGRSRE